MTLVGKILTGITALVCVVLMSFVLAVYAGHVDWKTKLMDPNAGIKVQLDKAKTERDQTKKRYDMLAGDFAAERKELSDRINNLKAEAEALSKERETLKNEKTKLETERSSKEEEIMKLQQSCDDLRKQQIEPLLKQIKDVKVEHVAEFQALVDVTDQLHQKINEYNALRDKAKTLEQDLAKARPAHAN